MSLLPESTADLARRRGLRRMRTAALLLLLLAAVVFALTQGRPGPWAYVHAAAEASMVGAIADWFAVTALFKRPLGLPIPHTAIIPTRKDALARNLQDFVTENFLTEDIIRARVAAAEVTRRVGMWLAEPANSQLVVAEVSQVVRDGLTRISDEDVETLLASEVLPRLVEEPLSEAAGRLLQEVVADAAHHGLVDLALNEAYGWLSAHQGVVMEIMGERAPWWTPQWVDERVTERLHAEVVAWVKDIRDDPDHDARLALDALLAQLATDLQHDPATMERAEALKNRLLSQPQLLSTATAIWNSLRRALMASLEDPESVLHNRAVQVLARFGSRAVEDPALRSRLDGHVSDAAVYFTQRYGAELTTVITETIQRWDGREAARRIELHVGRDLQFIRINGTLVGGLAGLVIYAVSVALSR